MDSNPNNNMIKSTISAGISHNKPTMFNISKYVQGVFSKAAVRAFPLPKDFVAQVNWNVTGSSDLASPSAMKIYNMNSRKEGWTLPSSKEVAQEIIANIEEAEQEAILGDIIISQQISNKKPEEAKKVEQITQGKKKEKVEQANFFIDINLKDSAIEKMSNNILKNRISLTTEHSGRNVLCDFSSPNNSRIFRE